MVPSQQLSLEEWVNLGYPSASHQAAVKLKAMQAFCPQPPPPGSPWCGQIDAGPPPDHDPAHHDPGRSPRDHPDPWRRRPDRWAHRPDDLPLCFPAHYPTAIGRGNDDDTDTIRARRTDHVPHRLCGAS
jgi:hypothetical protein